MSIAQQLKHSEEFREDSQVRRTYLTEAAEPVRERLAGSLNLRTFMEFVGTLTLGERKLIVDQAILLFEQHYVHLPLKVAMHAVNPLQRLRLLRTRLDRLTAKTMGPEQRFHAEMSEIFHSVRDLHTNYLLPPPFAGKIAYLPFHIEEYVDKGKSHYVVARILRGFEEPGFQVGREITHWCGIPIERAVDLNADRCSGSNAAARHSKGVESMTMRPLVVHLAPDEEWVTLTYRLPDGGTAELRHEWLVVENLPPEYTGSVDSVANRSRGIDLGADEVRRAKRILFAPQTLAEESPLGTTISAPGGSKEFTTEMPGVFRAREVMTSRGNFGHIRIFTFDVPAVEPFVQEFVRLIGLLPQGGLIVDVRGNVGGLMTAAECLLQTLTPTHVVPESLQFICTPLNLRLCELIPGLEQWVPSLKQAIETGSTYSAAHPLTSEKDANSIGQCYWGPVVLVTDARCYSATDIFAAGFQDHEIGLVLGADANTGAGGANVWEHGLLHTLMDGEARSPYRALPKGAGMSFSIRRTLRVGDLSGTPVEDLGVEPKVVHPMTKDDVLKDNVDLLDEAGSILAHLPKYRLAIQLRAKQGGKQTVVVDGDEIDRVDIAVDGRTFFTGDVKGSSPITVKVPVGTSYRAEGYLAAKLVAVASARRP